MRKNGCNVVDLEVFKTACKGCGQVFVNMQGRKFCTNECRERWYAEQHVAMRKPYPPPQEQTCHHCGKSFTGRRRRYCTFSCREAHHAHENSRACVECGTPFVSQRSERCRECRIIYERRRQHQAAVRRRRERPASHSAFSNTMRVGAKGEMLFDLLCCEKGWVSCRPIMETNPGFDRILIRDGRISRVQIKTLTGSRFKPGDEWELGGGFARLDFMLFDELAIVDVETADVWLVPKERIATAKVYMANHEEYRCNPFD